MTNSDPRPDAVGGWRELLSDDRGRVEVPIDHPLVKALDKAVREKQEARERANPPVYVDPRSLPPMGAA